MQNYALYNGALVTVRMFYLIPFGAFVKLSVFSIDRKIIVG